MSSTSDRAAIDSLTANLTAELEAILALPARDDRPRCTGELDGPVEDRHPLHAPGARIAVGGMVNADCGHGAQPVCRDCFAVSRAVLAKQRASGRFTRLCCETCNGTVTDLALTPLAL